MKPIVTLTMNPAIDKTTGCENMVPDRKLRCDVPNVHPGGGGINVSRVILRLGGRTIACYPRGGPIGNVLGDLLAEEGVDQIPIPIQDATRENIIVQEKTSGQQYRICMPGPELTKEEWQASPDKALALDPEPDYLVASGSLPRGVPDDFYGRLADRTRDRGIRLIVDTSGGALRVAAEAGVYLLKPNMRELGQLAGKEIESEEEQEQAALELVKQGHAKIVVVSLGAAGAHVVSEDGVSRVRAPTVNIRSKIGAGDSMVAGLVLGLAQGRSVYDAVRYGVAAGSAAVMTPGTELCHKEDVERLYQRMKSAG